MNSMVKLTAVLVLSAVALGGIGCATTPGAGQQLSYTELDEGATGLQPPRANTIYGMTRLMRAQGKNEQAELALIGLMKEYPNYSPTYNDLAEIRFQQGRFEEAVQYIERGLQVAPNDAVLLNNAGVCKLIKHDYEASLDYFKRASQIAPYENRYRANVALAMGLTGDAEGSRALYNQVVSPEAATHNNALIQSLVAPPAPVATAEAEQAAPLTFADFALLSPQEPFAAPQEPVVATQDPIEPITAPEPAAPAKITAPEPAAAPETISTPQPVTTEETIVGQPVAAPDELSAEQEPLAPNN